MEVLIDLLKTLNTLSPLAVIALLAAVLLLQSRNHKTVQEIKGNDLHDLPDVAQHVRDISATLQRIEVSQSENFSHIRAKLNGAK